MNSEDLFDRSITRAGTGFDQTFRHQYRTTIDDLWAAMTTPERVARWLGPVVEQPGGTTFVINIGSGDNVAPAQVEIQSCMPPTELIVDWQWQGEPTSRVSVHLHELDDQVELSLRHHDVSRGPLVVGYGGGWEWCLLALGVEAGAEGWTTDQLDRHEHLAQDSWRMVLDGIGH